MYTQYGNAMMGGQRMMDGYGLRFGGLGIIAAVGFIIIAAVVVAIVIWAIARKSSHTAPAVPAALGTATPTEDSALAIARDRLARGEIDPDQYTAIASALNGRPLSPPTPG